MGIEAAITISPDGFPRCYLHRAAWLWLPCFPAESNVSDWSECITNEPEIVVIRRLLERHRTTCGCASTAALERRYLWQTP